jgi:hypothetical protein
MAPTMFHTKQAEYRITVSTGCITATMNVPRHQQRISEEYNSLHLAEYRRHE